MAVIPTPVRLAATFFGAGRFPAASGTFGSMAALPFGIALLQIPAPFGRLALLCANPGIGTGAAMMKDVIGIFAG